LKNLKICDFDPMRTRAGISTSDIRFIISKTVSAVTADAMPQKCPPRDTKALATTVYPLQGRKVDPTVKKFSENNFAPPLRPEKYAESTGEIRFEIRSQTPEIFAIL